MFKTGDTGGTGQVPQGTLIGGAGAFVIPNGAQSVTIPFLIALLNTNYSVVLTFENSLDTEPQFLIALITAKTLNNFTATFNAPVDSANYKLNWAVAYDV